MKKQYVIRLLSLTLALSMCASLVGCGANTSSSTEATPSVVEESTSIPAEEKTETVEEETTESETEIIEEIVEKTEEVSAGPTPEKNENEEFKKKNSIAWLNYLACLSQEINSSKYSRMYLEEAYSSLIRNTNPENVNERTESHLASMLDSIEKYRMITVKRDRLQYLYEQNKAKAIRAAVPNPVGLLSAAASMDVKRLAASAIYMAVDSYTNYKAVSEEMALEYLQDGWELDDEEAENMHESRKRAFLYMIETVRDDKLPGELALNEKSVEDFVTAKNNDNIYQKIQFFESEESTYTAFGEYWLTLATCYYENEDYDKCLEAFAKYQELGSGIFRKDYGLAKALPNVIVAARETYSETDYVAFATEMLPLLKNNTENSDWSLKYFAAQMYIDLYARTKDSVYLEEAYNLALNNVNYLVPEQRSINAEYADDVKEISQTDTSSDAMKKKSKDEIENIKAENKKIKKYNGEVKEARKTELPSVYEPLELNCELLFALAKERGCSDAEKKRIDGITAGLFITEALNEKYSFGYKANVPDATYEKDEITMPVSCVSERSVLRVTVIGGSEKSTYEDWVVKKVNRPDKSKKVDDFTVLFTSKSAGKQEWTDGATIKVEIYESELDNGTPVTLNFKVNVTARKLLPDKIEYEQVK